MLCREVEYAVFPLCFHYVYRGGRPDPGQTIPPSPCWVFQAYWPGSGGWAQSRPSMSGEGEGATALALTEITEMLGEALI